MLVDKACTARAREAASAAARAAISKVTFDSNLCRAIQAKTCIARLYSARTYNAGSRAAASKLLDGTLLQVRLLKFTLPKHTLLYLILLDTIHAAPRYNARVCTARAFLLRGTMLDHAPLEQICKKVHVQGQMRLFDSEISFRNFGKNLDRWMLKNRICDYAQ